MFGLVIPNYQKGSIAGHNPLPGVDIHEVAHLF